MEVTFDAKAIGRWARQRNLRLLAHSRRIIFVMLPLGAFTGWMMGLAVKAYAATFSWVDAHLVPTHLVVLLPLVGLPLATMLLDFSGVGQVSLSEDIHLSRENPFKAFPFRKSLVKVLACFSTIFLGGSAGLEGPAKWFGGAVGLQVHRFLTWTSKPFRFLRRLKTEAGTMVVAGAAGAISSVLRAPLSAALYAAEHEGVLQTRTLIPSFFGGLIKSFRNRLAWIPLRWRGFVGGTWLPAVCIGACLGSAFDASFLPNYPGLLTMLGATALAGAFNGTILVPVVFLAETTAQAPLVVPTTVAYLVARDWD